MDEIVLGSSDSEIDTEPIGYDNNGQDIVVLDSGPATSRDETALTNLRNDDPHTNRLDDLLGRMRAATNNTVAPKDTNYDFNPSRAFATASDGIIDPKSPIKRRKRTALEIQKDKEIKERERDDKKRMREDTKRAKEVEKLERKIQREATSAQKSKSEAYTYCHVGKAVFDIVDSLELRARMLFMERNLDKNLILEDSLENRIEWRKVCVESMRSYNGNVQRIEYTCQFHLFAVVLTADVLRELVLSDALDDFVVSQQTAFPVANSHLILVCFGDLKLPPHKMEDVVLSLFESMRAQIRVVKDTDEMALFLAQILRGLSRVHIESDSIGSDDKLIIDVEKGVREASSRELVTDWWNKMLATVCRMGDAQRRAIVRHIPDPIAASTKYSALDYASSVAELSDIVCENGRRVGPVMAHRLHMMLTDTSGCEIVE